MVVRSLSFFLILIFLPAFPATTAFSAPAFFFCRISSCSLSHELIDASALSPATSHLLPPTQYFSCDTAKAPARIADTLQADTALLRTASKAESAAPDTATKPDSLAWRLRPELVALGAAILPGFGQVYNRAYWKLPIVYGLFAWFGYNYLTQQQKYLEFRQRYEDDLSKTPIPASAEANRRFREFYREQRDETIIYILLVYLASIVDAYVDAHLFGFDISDDLSQHQPATYPIVPIFSIKLKF
jgi:hypothetical protein